ncbi:helix-turn-helix domain-containing protein [Mycolicibacterium brumae]|uniref:HTH iclR-type domain-containing protein n=1 Tax=Mycolicibacterium brumae TaxID=85968 RepID=A0A2G5PA66_9MYCO|nr:helix-turn-helix domain-containing protein [Mycolicibacterium brumae]MCV7193376.1 helix-turn-helix domain-containing protein [Mycolicibacterium brumae]PIB74784.1 hypothetical protein CQY22_011715 [Mycolicibacterium brumae]UWW07255.1 helix-turn-helix domain-containing protein [Mycolicibacterium brumae]
MLVQQKPQADRGRSVLATGTHVVEAVAAAQHGIGITDLAQRTGLPKSTAHRLAGQLTESGLLERVGGRYYVGAAVGRWGRSRRPARTLHRAAALPVRRYAHLSRALVGVVALVDGRPETVLDHAADPLPFTVDLAAADWRRTAFGKVMSDRAIARDECGLLPGVSCIAGELELPGCQWRAALCALYFQPALPATATTQLVDAMRAIERNWARGLG